MKSVMFWAAALLALTLTACGDRGGDNNNNNKYAQTPNSTCNIPGSNPSACNPGIYQQYGWQVYPHSYNWGGYSAYCGCPAGYVPVGSMSWGFGCAPAHYLNNNYYMGWSYPQNNQWVNIPQISYQTGYSNVSSYNCYGNAARSCDTRVAGSCGAGGICQPVSAGSALGICQGGTTTSTNNYCRYETKWWGTYWVCGL